jgi:hypoxanthine phosphoribosyltransferase
MKCLILSIETVRKDCLKLASEIERTDFKPDCVVFIKSGGYLVGWEFANYFNVKLSGVRISREGDYVKLKLSFILKKMPKFIRVVLRTLEFKSGIHGRKNKRFVTEVDDNLIMGKNVLLVDDSVDTGNTIKVAIDFLKKTYGDNINMKVAGLNKFKLSEQLVNTDYYVHEDSLIICPWSKDSKEYGKFNKIYNFSGNNV